MKVLTANLSDIARLEEIAKASYKKMEFEGEYDSAYFQKTAEMQIDNESYIILKCVDDNIILGGLFAIIIPELYSPKTTLVCQYAMQADPQLPFITQGRVIIKLIKKLEDIASALNANSICFSADKKYDLSGFFEKKGYIEIEKKYARRLK
jgi:hypothetical protein